MIPTAIRRSLLRPALAGFCLLPVQSAFAETSNQEKTELEPLIVSALRVPREASTVTSSVTSLDPEQLETSGILQLRDALNAAPGVISTSTGGQTGAAGALFIRGTTTDDSQIVIDGMRLSDSSTPLGNILSAARTTDIGKLEILRGPQGAIYGGESIGGVLWMETPRGSGDPNGSATVEAGSFNSFFGRAKVGGEVGKMNYYLGSSHEQTDNDAPNQHFDQRSVALRVEGQADSFWTLGTTFRANDSYYENLGDLGNPYDGSDNRLHASLATLYAVGKFSDVWTGRFLAGYHQELYDNDIYSFGTDLNAFGVSTDQELTLAESIRLLGGGFFRDDSFEGTNGVDEHGNRYGAHSALECDLTDELTTTAAVRWERYDSYGNEATWRIGSVYHLEKFGTLFRGGLGRSFRAPSYNDLFYNYNVDGKGYKYIANPELRAQSSMGWDVGMEQKIGSSHTVEAVWFFNNIEDAIDSTFNPSGDGETYTAVNLPGTTRTNGTEFAVRGAVAEDAVSYRVAWTWLHESLKDQPRNAATASLDWKATEKSLIGIGATHLASHSWGGDPIDAYTVARFYGSYQVTEKVKLHARVENAFDADYELSNFFGDPIKGTGAGVYAGVTIDW
ncbi:MAG: TonB-dependent receptor plug domain-containing protein [Verrucomicrobiota bacterium]